ncbi:MAG: NfeD family protein [Microbacteriaceae bacterium]|nr:NfeD family protein [Microbacteriaceae bacterium]
MDFTQWTWIVWLSIAIACIVIELFTLEFTFATIGTGVLIGGLGATLLGFPWYVQIAAAAVLSALLLFIIRPLLRRLLAKHEDHTRHNIDAIAQQRGRVTRPFIDDLGEVKLENGETWSAKPAAAGEPFEVGDEIVVHEVRGAIVMVGRT